MGTIRTLEELAAIGRQRTVDGRSVSLRRHEFDGSVTLETVSAERVAFEHTTLDGPLTVRSCRLDELVIDHVTADSILVTNSRIGRLTVRNTLVGCDITVMDTSLSSLDLHTCGTVQVRRLRATQLVQFTALRGSVEISNSRVAALAFKSQVAAGRLGRPAIRLTGLHIAEDVLLDDLWLSSLDLREVSTRTLTLRRVRVDEPMKTAELRCDDAVRINGLLVPQTAGSISDSEIRGPVDIRDLRVHGTASPAGPAELLISNTTMGRLKAGSDDPAVISLRGSAVTGSLGLPAGQSRYDLDEGCSVNDVDLGGQTFHTSDQVAAFLRETFTDVTGVTLETLRVALARRNRNNEVDQLYYLARQREAARLPPMRRLFAHAVLGGVLGWGVRARNPVRVLLAGILVTAVSLHLAGALRAPREGLWNAGAWAKALVLSLALWLNVGTGAPSQLNTPAWTALAVGLTAAGVLLTTLIVGIVIRKLVQ